MSHLPCSQMEARRENTLLRAELQWRNRSSSMGRIVRGGRYRAFACRAITLQGSDRWEGVTRHPFASPRDAHGAQAYDAALNARVSGCITAGICL